MKQIIIIIFYSFFTLSLYALNVDTNLNNTIFNLCTNKKSCITNDKVFTSNTLFFPNLQGIHEIWIDNSSMLLTQKIKKHNLLLNNKNLEELVNQYGSATITAMYDLEQIQNDNFFLDDKTNYSVSVDGNELQICKYIRCNGNLPLQVRILFEFSLPK